MPRPTMLVVAAGLAIVGAAIGVNLGHATLDQINPANFRDSDSAFSGAAQDIRAPGDWAQVQAQEYRAASEAPAPQGCTGCTWPVAPVPPQDPTVARYDQPRTAVVPPERVEAPVRIVIREQAPEPDWTEVERYARYPVEQPVVVTTGTGSVGSQDTAGAGTQ